MQQIKALERESCLFGDFFPIPLFCLEPYHVTNLLSL
jgi:hypothetical protein